MTFCRPEGHQAALKSFYGNPDANGDGQPDPRWEAEYLTYIIPPYPMQWSWGGVCKKIRIHKKCAPSLVASLEEVGKKIPLAKRKQFQLDQCGGGYNFRLMRGSARTLSVHSYGAAIDLAPLINGLGVRYESRPNMMPWEVVNIFAQHGWIWGGMWGNPDPMHFQLTDPV